MKYVYGCKACGIHVDVQHSMAECDTHIEPCDLCGNSMKRIPQPVRHYNDPSLVLFDKMDERYRNYRIRQQMQRRPA